MATVDAKVLSPRWVPHVRKKRPDAAPVPWIATSDLPAPATSLYQQLDGVLAERQFGEQVAGCVRCPVSRTPGGG